MKLAELVTDLAGNASAGIRVVLPDGTFVPAHFHVTEVGRVHKDFIDCGGAVRSATSCVLQVWVASDVEHRLDAGKLARILQLAAPLLETAELPVEFEYENGAVSQYPLTRVEVTPSGLVMHLGAKHTACLAEERCGAAPDVAACCSAPSCCR